MKKILQIGLDFGTSNTGICAMLEDGSVEMLKDGSAQVKSFPTEIFFLNNDEFYVGSEAAQMAKNHPNTGRHLRWLKRILPKKIGMIRIYSTEYDASDLVAMVLDHAKTEIQNNYDVNWDIVKIKVGYPVVLGDSFREADLAKSRLNQALKKVGFANYELVPEPVAVAHYYSKEITQDTNVLIFDCGGGTTDLSFVQYKSNGDFDVLDNDGLMKAGNDFDRAVFIKDICPYLGRNLPYAFMRGKELEIADLIYRMLGDTSSAHKLLMPRYLDDVVNAIKVGKKVEYQNMKFAITEQKSVYLLGKAEQLKITLAQNDLATEKISLSTEFTVKTNYKNFLHASMFLREYITKLIKEFMIDKPKPDLVIMTGGMSKHRVISDLVKVEFPDLEDNQILSKDTDAILLGLGAHK